MGNLETVLQCQEQCLTPQFVVNAAKDLNMYCKKLSGVRALWLDAVQQRPKQKLNRVSFKSHENQNRA